MRGEELFPCARRFCSRAADVHSIGSFVVFRPEYRIFSETYTGGGGGGVLPGGRFFPCTPNSFFGPGARTLLSVFVFFWADTPNS